MYLRWTDKKTGQVTDIPGLRPSDLNGRMRDLAALQRETKWKLAEINELGKLEGPSFALAVFLSFRATGRLITYARAEELLDEVDPVIEPGDEDDEEEDGADPTSAPTASVRGDERPAEDAGPTGSLT